MSDLTPDASGGTPRPEELFPKIDRRYRESRYFLVDQLRYSESIQDFRTVKHAILRSHQFQLVRHAFQFVRIPFNPL